MVCSETMVDLMETYTFIQTYRLMKKYLLLLLLPGFTLLQYCSSSKKAKVVQSKF
jgi:hypothetical protein